MYILPRKILSILVFAILISNICVSVNSQNFSVMGTDGSTKEQEMTLSFPQPKVDTVNGYDWLTIDNCSYVSTPGYPMLPIKTVTFKIPQNSAVTSTAFQTNETNIQGIYSILPASIPTSQTTDNKSHLPNVEIYGSNIFPNMSYSEHEATGIDIQTNSQVKYVILNLYPISWSPTKGNATLLSQVKITITYSILPKPLANSLTAQLQNLIITSPLLQPYALNLCSWKNQTGILSKVIDTTTIYSTYSGVDNPEKIRNCIKDYFSTYGVIYVTIFGDVNQVPIRYAYIPDSQSSETIVFQQISTMQTFTEHGMTIMMGFLATNYMITWLAYPMSM